MAIKQTLIVLIFFNCITTFSQLEVIDINLDKNESTINIISDTIFYIEKKTIIKVEYTGDGKIAVVTNSEGSVRNLHHNRFEISFPNNTLSEATVIKIYEKTPKNELKLLKLQSYYLRRLPTPEITIGGVKNDSAINIEHLIKDYIVRARHPITKNNLDIIDYYIKFPKEDSIYVKGNKMSTSLKNKIYSQKEGSVLTLYNIRTIMPDKRIYTTNQVSIFLILNDQYSVGDRKYIQK